ncbi:MAG: tetratricopeptide repeat protein [Saprospiraceae bacterium]|nr:tetratricopeptide repeat protein [Saprospiraceae bacterium]
MAGLHYFEMRNDTLNDVFAQIVYDLCRVYDFEFKLDTAFEAINRYIKLIGILFPEETKEHGYGQFMLGNIYMRTDHLDKSKICFQNAKQIFEKTIGIDHPDYGNCLNNFGLLCLRTGDVYLSEKLIIQGMKVRERFLEKSMDYYHSLNNLGNLYVSQFDFINAEKSYIEAGKILKL